MAAILTVTTHWHCPNCKKDDVTREARPHSRFHVCPRLRGLTAPMVRAGTSAKVEVREREDYVGGDHGRVMLDPEHKRPVMSIVTTRDNGTDCAVFAPVANAKGA